MSAADSNTQAQDMIDRQLQEIEMLAIINMQDVSEALRKGKEELSKPPPAAPLESETASTAASLSTIGANPSVADDVSSEILKPGTKIRPDVNVEDARKLAERLYGIVASEIEELVSYDDRNFLIKADSNIKNPIIGNQSPHGYVLKIQNSLDSRKTGFIDAQTQLMIFLGQKDINCPRPIMNINGKYFSHERFTTDDQLESTNVVRLLQFVPGRLFHQIATKSSHLFYQAGQYVARLDTALRHFQHEAYAHHRTLWQMEATPRLADFVYALHDETKREIVDQVLEAYERRVAPHAADFGRGIIHGDFNEQNIVVSSSKSDDPNVEATWRIEGIIDFGDTVESCYVFELAIAMTYMMLQSGELSTGGLVLAGYQTIRPLPLAELQVLRVCVAARLCQSLVLGAYSHSLEPENDYLLTTQAAGWKLLDDLWSQLPEKDVLALWQSTADAYLTRSEK